MTDTTMRNYPPLPFRAQPHKSRFGDLSELNALHTSGNRDIINLNGQGSSGTRVAELNRFENRPL
jgi:hypothetical protein